MIIPCPFRGLKDQLGPWDPSCTRHGMDNNQTRPLARWFVDPRPIFFKIPGKLPWALIMASATLYSPSYATARRGGLRGAGGISTEARIAANIDRGFCP